MKRMVSVLVLTAVACPSIAMAGAPAADQRVAAYDECLMGAAVRASYTPVANEQIFDIARSACAKARTRAAFGSADQRAALDAVDAHKAANLPDWVGTLRDRRRSLDAMYGTQVAVR